MQINVSQLLKEPVGSSREYEIDKTLDDVEDNLTIPVKGTVKLTRTNRSVLVNAKFSVSVKTTCARCLEDFSCPLEVTIEEEYFPLLDMVSKFEESSPEEFDRFTIDEHQILDLTEAIRQYSLLAIPMKPLCSDDCPGV